MNKPKGIFFPLWLGERGRGGGGGLPGNKSFWMYWGDDLSLERRPLWYILWHTLEQAIQRE